MRLESPQNRGLAAGEGDVTERQRSGSNQFFESPQYLTLNRIPILGEEKSRNSLKKKGFSKTLWRISFLPGVIPNLPGTLIWGSVQDTCKK